MHVFGQVFGHAFGQRGAERPITLGRDLAHFVQKVIDLHLNRTNFDDRVKEARRTNDLFGKDTARLFQLPRGRRCRYIDRLRTHGVPFFKLERAVIHTGRQTEPVLCQREFTTVVALIHAADLRHGHVAFVGKNDRVVRDKFEQRWRWLARGAARQIPRIVFDAVTDARRFEHLEVKVRSLLKTLCLQ